MAKVSMRLVPNQDPKKIGDLFEAYVKKVTPKTVELKVTRMHGGKPWMTAFDNPFVQAAGRAIEQGFGQRPVFNREGGSIPVVATFQEELGLPCVLFGVGLAGRKRPRAGREARSGQLPQRDHRLGVSLQRDRCAFLICAGCGSSMGCSRNRRPIRFSSSSGKSCRATRCRRGAISRGRRCGGIPALTPDAVSRAASKELLDAVALAGPHRDERIEQIRMTAGEFKRHRSALEADALRSAGLGRAARLLRRLSELPRETLDRALLFCAEYLVTPMDDPAARVVARLQGTFLAVKEGAAGLHPQTPALEPRVDPPAAAGETRAGRGVAERARGLSRSRGVSAASRAAHLRGRRTALRRVPARGRLRVSFGRG